MPSSLENIRVLDLSRILAGPVATQMLGDLGAEIIKIERPDIGDDTRHWGPPFVKDDAGVDTDKSAYFLSANRNKKSVTIDISKPEGQALIHALAAKSDVLIHNFKVGALEEYGLGFDDIHNRHPHLVYAAITGYGQTGPMADEPGYDILAQALCGLMGHTGAAGDAPMKAGVALVDVITGLYAATGILAAIHARQTSGKGQMIDLALLDCGLASMTNIAQYYLTSGKAPARQGNAHATIVPYQAFAAKDGWIIIAAGNDPQFLKLCDALGRPQWKNDARFRTNASRVENRDILVPLIEMVIAENTVAHWLQIIKAVGIPAAPVHSIDGAFAMDQIQAREMQITLPDADGSLQLTGNPLKLSQTPVSYRLVPPSLGEHTKDVLQKLLGLSTAEIDALRVKSVI